QSMYHLGSCIDHYRCQEVTRGRLLRLPTRLLRRRLLPLERRLDVEAHVEDVAVLHLVGLALEALETAPGRLRVRARLDQIGPSNDLAPDEPACEIGVNGGRGVERGLTPAQGHGACLIVDRG